MTTQFRLGSLDDRYRTKPITPIETKLERAMILKVLNMGLEALVGNGGSSVEPFP